MDYEGSAELQRQYGRYRIIPISGTLYIVATPIGNLADISRRALDTLRDSDLIAAEDTRVTRKLLSHFEIKTPLTPYHQHSLSRKAHELVEILKSGKNVALVSDAGTPGISDPGHEIIALAIENGIPIVSIPGANAIVTALVVSGLDTRRFIFDGFPPRSGKERRAYFRSIESEPRTIVLYESPHRILRTLKDMLDVLGDRRMAVVREATKVFEEVHRGTVSTAIERFTKVSPKGEITLVLTGCENEKEEEPGPSDIEKYLVGLIESGVSERDAVKETASALSVPKRDVYRLLIEMKNRP